MDIPRLAFYMQNLFNNYTPCKAFYNDHTPCKAFYNDYQIYKNYGKQRVENN